MKKVIFALALVLTMVNAEASYLLWQVGSSVALDDGTPDWKDYNTARVWAVNDSGSTTLLMVSYGGATDLKNVATPMNNPYASVDLSQLTDAGSYSFYIELTNYDSGKHMATSETLSYSSLAENGFITSSLSGVQSMQVWHGGTYHAVPEPTSAMLVLMGIALVTLKRRKL